MTGLPVRLYGSESCPHCMAAIAFLQSSKVPTQLVPVLNDPVIHSGLSQLFGTEIKLPVLVSLGTNEIIVGFKSDEYERIAKSFYVEPDSGAPGEVGAESQHSGETPEVAVGETPEAQGAA